MENEQKNEVLAISDAQLLLAEKRTVLAEMRIGISVLIIPLTIVSFLIATSKYYHPTDFLEILVILGIIILSLIILGGYLIIHSLLRLRHYEQLLQKIKFQDKEIGQYLD